jgi:hypothetical protein
MPGLYISLALLGLSAVDPVGIGVMPVLLIQERPYKRAFVFLAGSFLSLMVIGVVFAKGLGEATVVFERNHTWLVPGVEAAAGVILLVIATAVFAQLKSGVSMEPSGRTRRWLQLGSWQLFSLGALLVAVQSIVDVVFVIAMVRVGQLKLSGLALVTAVATYAVTALVFQLAVVGAFRVAPAQQRAKTLDVIRRVLVRYSNQTLVAVSLVLGVVLIAFAIVRV